VEDASKEGLRTLLIAMKVVSQKQLEHFEKMCQLAEENIVTREVELQQVYDEFERGLVVLGATAVEDQLQDQVPETIKSMQQAGIKIWMLTGDKFETAENVGFSCRLIGPEFNIFRIKTAQDVEKICSPGFITELKSLKERRVKFGLIVEASVLPLIQNKVITKMHFLQAAKACDAVICCRVTPG
jgi:magnesium-transporting ATPase (P-type)